MTYTEGQRFLLLDPREDEQYDRQELFGRDAASVFPTESKAKAKEEVDALKDAVGGSRFISETEVRI